MNDILSSKRMSAVTQRSEDDEDCGVDRLFPGKAGCRSRVLSASFAVPAVPKTYILGVYHASLVVEWLHTTRRRILMSY